MSKRVLVVDDSVVQLRLITDILASAGHQTVVARDGLDGLNRAIQADFDWIVSDQQMPRLDGIGLIRALRKNDRHRTTPILMLTTECSERLRLQAQSAGADAWMCKPVDATQLLRLIEQIPARSSS